jgi:hypothetical protein
MDETTNAAPDFETTDDTARNPIDALADEPVDDRADDRTEESADAPVEGTVEGPDEESAAAAPVERGRQPRQTGRVRLELVSSNWGRVVDISAGGARVRGPRRLAAKVGSTIPLRLSTADAEITVPARVVWKRRVGLFAGEMGLVFDALNRGQQFFLMSLARSCASNEHVRHPIYRKCG